MIFINVVI